MVYISHYNEKKTLLSVTVKERCDKASLGSSSTFLLYSTIPMVSQLKTQYISRNSELCLGSFLIKTRLNDFKYICRDFPMKILAQSRCLKFHWPAII